MKESSSSSAKTGRGGGKSEREADGMRKSEKRGKRPGERYSTLYREISIMRICNFNASPNPAKLPKRKPAASTLRANPEHRGSSLVHPIPHSLRRASRVSAPLSPCSYASAFTAVASIAESHNASSNLLCATTQFTYSNASRTSLPRDQIDSVRVSSPELLFSDFFHDCQASSRYLSAPFPWQVDTRRIN